MCVLKTAAELRFRSAIRENPRAALGPVADTADADASWAIVQSTHTADPADAFPYRDPEQGQRGKFYFLAIFGGPTWRRRFQKGRPGGGCPTVGGNAEGC